ncbi:ATP-binding cassette, subfamily B [Bowdeniella nasicola]|uniref:Fatty acid ABC transporter ATP-binding/permease protein n=1 Tax=Bowdeniella nasicola TaxID=208480 RepID=A0A1H4DFF2_9ACTO|nr:ABC transporter ATP-binding protein [Bowdeniella nasicola]SEA71481.1 ATP-binding cassette, subfamily B [Bowdeniella nasicola]
MSRGVDPTRRSRDVKGAVKRTVAYLRPERTALIIVVALMALAVAAQVYGPKVLGQGTNLIVAGMVGRSMPAGATAEQVIAGLRAAGEQRMADALSTMDFTPGVGIDTGQLARVLGLALVLYVASTLLMWISSRMIAGIVQRSGYRLRAQVNEHIDALPLSYLDSHARGDLLSRVTNDIDNLTQTLQQSLSQIIQSVFTVVGILAMMVWISWELSLIALIVVPVALIATALIAKRAQPHFGTQWRATGEVGAIVEESFTGHEIIAAYGLQSASEADFAKHNEELANAVYRSQFISGTIMPTMNLLSNISYVLIAVVGGIRIANGQMNVGDIQAFIQYSRQFNQPLAQLGSMVNLIQSGAASAERIFDLLDAPEQRPDTSAAHLPPNARGVSFEHVRFSYKPGVEVIRDLSLTVEPGQTVAIVGPTGAGKTTLVNLLMRFYEVDSGHIRIDGIDIADVDRDELRERFGMVLQDTWLFEGTIADNIAFGKAGASRADVEAAAVDTGVDAMIRTLPEGYDTVISEEAETISAGEKQLITIARAFLADPQILILDEATSSVDTRTEMLVQQAMTRLRAGRTGFIIAHRLSTIRDADVIVVMEDGDVVETGNHDSLLAAGGHYANLYQAQFAGIGMGEADD